MGKTLFAPFQDSEINYTSNIYPSYLAYSTKGLSEVISNEMPNIEQFQYKSIDVMQNDCFPIKIPNISGEMSTSHELGRVQPC